MIGAPDEAGRREIFERDIVPLLFPGGEAGGQPTLVLVAGQAGAGRSRATGRLIREHDGALAVVDGEELRAFHPGFAEFAAARSEEATQVLARASAGWVRDGIRFARQNRHSLLLEGTFPESSVVAAMVARFAAEGFTSRVVVVGSRRAESLMTVTSRYLRDVLGDVPAHYTSREVHDRGLEATRSLVAEFEESPFAERLTVLDRAGRPVFDARRSDGDGVFRGASSALMSAQSARLSRFDATQWLSELHHATKFATSRRDLPVGVTQTLVDLHETAIREVIPELRIPEDGKFRTAIEQRTVAGLVALQTTLRAAAPTVDAAAPVVTPAQPERGISR